MTVINLKQLNKPASENKAQYTTDVQHVLFYAESENDIHLSLFHQDVPENRFSCKKEGFPRKTQFSGDKSQHVTDVFFVVLNVESK